MAKSLFNFYLDDEVKEKATEKLERLAGKKSKGQLASLIRVYLNVFLATPDNKISNELLEAVESEYQYSTKLNKRSKL